MDAKRVTPEEFKKEAAKPGTKSRFLINVGELSIGSEVLIPVVVVRGKKDGPKVYVGAGTHAEETGSIEAVKRFSAQLNPDDVSGTIVVVPLQNVPAYAFRSRLYPLDAPTVADLFGHPKGDLKGILTERVLFTLVECIGTGANFALDVHSTHLDSINYPFTFVFNTGAEAPDVQKKRLELARAVGNEIIWINDGGSKGGFTWLMNSKGCPTLSFESGEGWRNLEPFPSILMRGVKNFCKAAGALKGAPEKPSIQIEVTKRAEIISSRGGMSNVYVKPGQYVSTGQVVAEVRDMFDDVLEELKTPVSGIIQRVSLLPTVATGARLCNVSITDKGKEWEGRTVPELEKKITMAGWARQR